MSIRENLVYSIILNISNVIFPLITFPFASRILGPEGIGLVNLSDSYSKYFLLFAMLGVPIYGVREIAKVSSNPKELKKTFSEILTINFLAGILVLTVYTISILIIPQFQPYLSFYFLAGLTIIFGIFTLDWYFVGLQEFKFITFRSILSKLLALILLFLALKNKNDAIYYLMSMILASFLNSLFNLYTLYGKQTIQIHDLNLKRHLKPLLFIFGTTAAISIYTLLDSVILGFLTNHKSVGLYDASTKLSKLGVMITVSMGSVLMPKIASILNDKEKVDELLLKSMEFIIFISIPISVTLFLMAKEITLLFAGNEFLPSVLGLKILSFLPFIIGLNAFLGVQILTPLSKDKQVFICVSSGMIMNLILNFALIPFYSYNGAIISTLITELIVFMVSFIFARKYYDLNIPVLKICYALISCIPFILIQFLMKNFISSNLILVFVNLICYAITYFIIQHFIFKSIISNEMIIKVI